LEHRDLLSVLYVDDTAPGLNDGTSWTDAYVSLQSALEAAISGDVVRVAEGTYRPTAGTDRTVSFELKNGVSILGGYAGYGAADPSAREVTQYVTVLSGDIGSRGATSDNSFHVVVGGGTDSTAVLDGFSITAGNANGSSPHDRGGGMYNKSSSPTLVHCTFAANSAGYGGGMANYSLSSPTLTHCTFRANSATSGGGMANYSSSAPTLTDCTFTANSAASGFGGGICNVSSSPTLTNCTFWANSATSGGGMSNYPSASPTLTNCIFAANSATSGGGMFNYRSPSPTLINCTLTANSAGDRGGGMCNLSSSPVVTNCIAWGNTAPSGSQIWNDAGTPLVTYCDIEGGYEGTGNVNLAPQFVRSPSPGPDGTWRTADDDYGDLRLLPTSPCIDAGSNAAVPEGMNFDLAGSPRVVGNTAPAVVDMGAYESPGSNLAFTGTSDPDDFALGLAADGTTLRIVTADGSYTSPLAAISSLAFFAASGADRLTVDFANGSPLPVGGVTFDGGDVQDPGDNLILKGLSGTTPVEVAADRVLLAGPARIDYSHALVVLGGTNSFSGGTSVSSECLFVAGADALPRGGSLTIGPGATVVLASGLNSASVGSAAASAGPAETQPPPATPAWFDKALSMFDALPAADVGQVSNLPVSLGRVSHLPNPAEQTAKPSQLAPARGEVAKIVLAAPIADAWHGKLETCPTGAWNQPWIGLADPFELGGASKKHAARVAAVDVVLAEP
jgi:hypothetical protein